MASLRTWILLLAVACLPALGIVACDDDDDDVGGFIEADFNKIMPLRTGNFWTYRESQGGFFTYDVTGIRRIDGLTFYRVDPDEQPDLITEDLLGNDNLPPTGLYFSGKNSNPRLLKPPQLVAQYPAQAGDTWAAAIGLSENAIPTVFEYTVESVDELISVTAGDFLCHRYFVVNTDNPSLALREWYAPGVGLIQRHYYQDGGTVPLNTQKLWSYGIYAEDQELSSLMSRPITPQTTTPWPASSLEMLNPENLAALGFLD